VAASVLHFGGVDFFWVVGGHRPGAVPRLNPITRTEPVNGTILMVSVRPLVFNFVVA
jgi:hypothetical protein